MCPRLIRSDKTEVLKIRCSRKTKERFRQLAEYLDVTYEGLLRLLLDCCEDRLRRRLEFL